MCKKDTFCPEVDYSALPCLPWAAAPCAEETPRRDRPPRPSGERLLRFELAAEGLGRQHLPRLDGRSPRDVACALAKPGMQGLARVLPAPAEPASERDGRRERFGSNTSHCKARKYA